MSDQSLIPVQQRLASTWNSISLFDSIGGDGKMDSIKTHGSSSMIPFAMQLSQVCSDFHPSMSSFILSLRLKHLW